MNVKKRINELINILNSANYNYHVLDNPTITDQEYDKFLRELTLLEEQNPLYKREDSPTTRIGGEVIGEFNKIIHETPMLSLNNVFNENEIIEFDERIKKEVSDPQYVCELKIDGLAVSLIYKNGKLIRGVTRGDGVSGEDITHNVKTVKSIPLTLNKAVDIEVRGEIYMSKKSFNSLNELRAKNNQDLFANPRNAAAGSVRQLDSSIAATRKLDCFIYHLPDPINHGINKQTKALNLMKSLGFTINPNIKVVNNLEELLEYIKYWTVNRNELPYEIDGIVIKLEDINDQILLGYTSKYPKWATAYKFPATAVLTKLKDIKLTVGRTGKITPNAVLEPVILMGSRVAKATLHNEEYVLNNDIRIGDIVSVIKAGDVIPRVEKPIVERRTGKEKTFVFSHNCPICSQELTRTEADHYCINPFCDAKIIESLIHYVSRDALNIDGLGEKIIEDFYNFGYLKSFIDIYDLKNKKEELKELEGFGEKSINKILESIEESKTNSFDRLLFALGIRHVGSKTAKILAKEYQNINNLIQATTEELANTKEIGSVIADSVYNFFKDQKNLTLIEQFKQLNINMEQKNINNQINENFNNFTFVLTGSLESFTREELTLYIEANNGNVSTSVSAKTNVLIVGDSPGSKYDKALQLGIEIWNEEKLKEMINK